MSGPGTPTPTGPTVTHLLCQPGRLACHQKNHRTGLDILSQMSTLTPMSNAMSTKEGQMAAGVLEHLTDDALWARLNEAKALGLPGGVKEAQYLLNVHPTERLEAKRLAGRREANKEALAALNDRLNEYGLLMNLAPHATSGLHGIKVMTTKGYSLTPEEKNVWVLEALEELLP